MCSYMFAASMVREEPCRALPVFVTIGEYTVETSRLTHGQPFARLLHFSSTAKRLPMALASFVSKFTFLVRQSSARLRTK